MCPANLEECRDGGVDLSDHWRGWPTLQAACTCHQRSHTPVRALLCDVQVLGMLVRGDGEASLLGEGALSGVLAACTRLLPPPLPPAAAAAPGSPPRAAMSTAGQDQQQAARRQQQRSGGARSRSAALGAVHALGACLFSRAALLEDRGGAPRPAAIASLASLFQLACLAGVDPQERESGPDQAAGREAEGGTGGAPAAPSIADSTLDSSSREAARRAWDGGRALRGAVAAGVTTPQGRRQLRAALLRPVRASIGGVASHTPLVRTTSL